MEYQKEGTYQTQGDLEYSGQVELIGENLQPAKNVLEKIAASSTKIEMVSSEEYNVDKCNCGTCGCIRGDILLILSPAGIATSVSFFGPVAAIS